MYNILYADLIEHLNLYSILFYFVEQLLNAFLRVHWKADKLMLAAFCSDLCQMIALQSGCLTLT